jgi:hypothetical protein
MSEPKNITVSVKDRLRDIARREKKSHQLLLLRYFQERFFIVCPCQNTVLIFV